MQKTLYSQNNERLAKWLKQQRIEAGYTVRELAEKLHLHHSIIGKMETGHRRVDVVEYVHVCRALGVDPCEGLKTIRKVKF